MSVRKIVNAFEAERAGEYCLYCYEPLNTSAPETARPWCCYINTVIFYRKDSFEQVDQVETEWRQSIEETLVLHDGIWWELCSGKVEWHNDQWHMRWLCRKNTAAAQYVNEFAEGN